MWEDRIKDVVLAMIFVATIFLFFFGLDRFFHWLKNRGWKEDDENNRDPPDFTRMGDGTVNR